MSSKQWFPWVVLAALAATSGCERSAAPAEFPQGVADAWVGSFNGGDVAGLALMYSQDAKLMPPDEPVASGPAAIEAFWQGFNAGQVRIEVNEVEARRLGEYWFREGIYKAQFADEGDPRVGKFIELWKSEGNNWMLYRQIWNRNAPPPAQPPETATSDEPA